jgi:hypothetical protein
LREHIDHVWSFYEATAGESSNVPREPPSFNRGNPGPLEDLDTLSFGSSCLLPVQYYDRVCRRRLLSGEEKLMFAVLTDALRCYMQFVTCRNVQERRHLGELECWFRDNDQSGIFSFKSLCQTFGIDANVLRNSLGIAHVRQKLGFRQSDWMD